MEQLAGSDEKAGRAGSVLVNIAGYRDAAGDRYLAVWSKKGHGFQNRFLAGVDVTDDDARSSMERASGKRFFSPGRELLSCDTRRHAPKCCCGARRGRYTGVVV